MGSHGSSVHGVHFCCSKSTVQSSCGVWTDRGDRGKNYIGADIDWAAKSARSLKSRAGKIPPFGGKIKET